MRTTMTSSLLLLLIAIYVGWLSPLTVTSAIDGITPAFIHGNTLFHSPSTQRLTAQRWRIQQQDIGRIKNENLIPWATTTISTTTTVLKGARLIATFDETDFATPAGGKQDTWPYDATTDLNRLDNSVDTKFYDQPRFVAHIDDGAISSLTEYYRDVFTQQILSKTTAATMNMSSDKNADGDKSSPTSSLNILDLCSSWISHFPKNGEDDTKGFIRYGRVVGLGMNEAELQANTQLTEFVVQDLNKNPFMQQFQNESFDVICNVVSVDYLIQPLQVFEEMYRLLRPGGVAIISFSNRCFPTKAIAMWLQADDIGRLTIVASYFHYSAIWSVIEALDLKETQPLPERPSAKEIFANPSLGLAWMNTAATVQRNNQGDPMYVVKGVK
jgi:SAM-dependent methyltransferase